MTDLPFDKEKYFSIPGLTSNSGKPEVICPSGQLSRSSLPTTNAKRLRTGAIATNAIHSHYAALWIATLRSQ